MSVKVDLAAKILFVEQEITYTNATGDTLSTIILNDWNNAYSDKNSPLGKRFSDEFVKTFHLAKKSEIGGTNKLVISDENKTELEWNRDDDQPDLVEIILPQKLLPNQVLHLHLTYQAKIPSDKFTKYGYDDKGGMYLKNWFLAVARYENHSFLKYSNENFDDIANEISDYEIAMSTPANTDLVTDLKIDKIESTYNLLGKNRTDFNIFILKKSDFEQYKNDKIEVYTNLKSKNVNNIQKALIVDRITRFVDEHLGQYPHERITVSQADYEKSPFYGLNQLPSFLSPFTNDFLFEIKFLKTYLNNYLKNSLRLNQRKDNWIFDGLQVYTMMQYIDENYPNSKMMGGLSRFRLLRNYNLTQLPFNEQYSYFYMLMARKNLDQPLGTPKNKLIRFNEQIAGKYRAGLSLRYLADFMGKTEVQNSISKFYTLNTIQAQTDRADFENILKTATPKKIDWFFNTIIDSREIVDYKFGNVSKTNDSVTFTVKNRTNTTVPVSVYGVNKKQVVFKEWLENISTDSTFRFPRKGASKIVLNYNNEIPEYNLRNNWYSLKNFKISNRPIKFVFMKDLEDPYYNQILYVPTVGYNLYDGLTPGLRFHNKTILDKPFVFDVNPMYSPNNQSLIGRFSLLVNQYNRNSDLYNIRYTISGSYMHYAPDAAYSKLNPAIFLRLRESDDFRDNHKQFLSLRSVLVSRENTTIPQSEETVNYNVFNLRYTDTYTEVTKHLSFMTDLQASKSFGKASVEFGFRKLFNDNRQLNVRVFAGTFLYRNTDTDYFSFGLDRPTDYLFDYDYYGRSETTGIFSQQVIIADGGFKSKLSTPFANQWMATTNMSFNVWNWVEVYGDAGFIKNEFRRERFVYDSGIRLNLVTDYFELYFPVYSNNGWEISQPHYNEKIRFVVTLEPKILVNLFTRKWF
ncbi:aminopeptidase [Flavobacterium sp. 3HN19-14]|uniref:aminopeptidase n=1 Tax=Flavobacterium sp. 3HN19-14 TaxID=3448133 RepID=UPI003EDE839A